MIKVKTFFISNSFAISAHERLDNKINTFLIENDVDVVDIKYSVAATSGSNGGVSVIPSAMLIYKTKD